MLAIPRNPPPRHTDWWSWKLTDTSNKRTKRASKREHEEWTWDALLVGKRKNKNTKYYKGCVLILRSIQENVAREACNDRDAV